MSLKQACRVENKVLGSRVANWYGMVYTPCSTGFLFAAEEAQ